MTPMQGHRPASGELSAKADRHLWGHFARHGAGITPPIITRGEGVHIWDDKGKRYIDGLSGLSSSRSGTVAPNSPRPIYEVLHGVLTEAVGRM